MKETEMGTLRRTERPMMRAICGVQVKDLEISMVLMFMLGLNETIDQLAISNSVCWYGHVLRRSLDFKVEGQRKKWRPKSTW